MTEGRKTETFSSNSDIGLLVRKIHFVYRLDGESAKKN